MEINHEWNFGYDRLLADDLKQLVLSGKKKATTGLYSGRASKAGDYEALLDFDQKRFCIVRITKVEIKPFLEVDYAFILKEGEDDKDVEEWREKHRKFLDLKDDEVNVICLEFEVVEVL